MKTRTLLKVRQLLLATVILTGLSFETAFAQWSTNGNHIHNSNSGNVGVGTSTPQAKFHVSSGDLLIDNQRYIVARRNDGTPQQIFGMDSNNDMILNRSAIVGGLPSRTIIAFGGNGKTLDFRNQSNQTVLRVRDNGYVGIGTLNPQSMLAVNGTITSQEVEVTMDGWSDFVFEEDYKLMPLGDLEHYIDEHKHLPDVPAEEEVVGHSIKLGEMDALLLQKIEELTLYLIDMKKENEQLKQRITQLENN